MRLCLLVSILCTSFFPFVLCPTFSANSNTFFASYINLFLVQDWILLSIGVRIAIVLSARLSWLTALSPLTYNLSMNNIFSTSSPVISRFISLLIPFLPSLTSRFPDWTPLTAKYTRHHDSCISHQQHTTHITPKHMLHTHSTLPWVEHASFFRAPPLLKPLSSCISHAPHHCITSLLYRCYL